MILQSNFQEINQSLAAQFANQYSCPLYLIDYRGIRERLQQFQKIAKQHCSTSIVALSYKTNPLQGLLARLHTLGAYAEVVSGEEYGIAKKLGIAGNQIIFNGPMKTDAELLEAIHTGSYINCDHLDEIERIEALAKSQHKVAKIGIRLCFPNGYNWTRFGFEVDQSSDSPFTAHIVVKKIASSSHLILSGIHAHIGTNIRDMNCFSQLGKKLAGFAEELLTQFNIHLEWIDVGGGLAGISPRIDEKQYDPHPLPNLELYINSIVNPLKNYLSYSNRQPILFFEPGRTLFEPFGALLTRVVGRRCITIDHAELICDAGLNILPSCQVYNHPLHILQKKNNQQKLTTLYGPTCNQIDRLHEPMLMPELNPGDLILFYGVGAYSISFSYSFIRYRPGIVLWHGEDHAEWLRYPESLAHLSQLEVLPSVGS